MKSLAKPKSVVHVPPHPEVVSATTLLRGQPVLLIEHGGERYQLRLTKNGKLILTK